MGSNVQETGLKEEVQKIYNLLKVVGIAVVAMVAVDIVDNVPSWLRSKLLANFSLSFLPRTARSKTGF